MSAITYYRGDTVGIKLKLRDRSTLAPLDLTGKTLTLTVDPSENPSDNVANVMQLAGTVFGDPVDGIAVFVPSAGETDFDAGEYWYDVEIKNTADDSERQTIVKDNFVHKQDITK